MKKISLLLILTIFSFTLYAQPSKADSAFLISLNQQIDNYVVERDTAELEKLYAEDFVFSHGSGRTDYKQSWIVSVAKGNFLSRLHDSVTVELHPNLGILRGKLSVQKKNQPVPPNAGEKIDQYHLKYVRVYGYRNKQWELLSHVTTWEVHE